jgi:hypothetical protein
MPGEPITAVIGVRHDGPLTWYAKRSMAMGNYPGVWSLPSIQFTPDDMTDPKDLEAVSRLMRRMSAQRLGGVDVAVMNHLVSGSSDMNPMGVDVTLHLYRIGLEPEPTLDPAFYSDARWLDVVGYQSLSAGQPCGLCTRLWSDHAWLTGVTDRPFLPTEAN